MMTDDLGITYRYAQHGPVTAMLRRATALSVIIGTIMMTVICIVGVLPLVFLPFGEIFLVAVAVGTYYFGSIQFKRGFIVATPSHFVIKNWFSRQEVLWEDVTSVAVESFKPGNAFSKAIMRLAYGSEGEIPFVKFSLRRSRFVGGIPGMRVIALYLEEPEKFVEQAQRFLVPESTHSAHA